MSTNGQLVFTDVDKITFKGVGNASNAVIDTLTGKIGVGVDSPDANLHVVGNSYVSTNLELGGTLIMGTVNVEAQHSLEAVTATGNTTPLTIEFTNPTTGIVATGNVEVGGDVVLSGNIYNNANLSVQYTTIFPTWTQVGQDIDGEAASDYSGWSVSMSSDGTRMAIGAIYNDDTAYNAGHVRVYYWNSGTSQWTQVGQDIDGEAASDQSGQSVSMSSDGTRVAIGAIRNDGTAGDAGHVRVYAESGGTWTQVGSDIDGEAGSDKSGYSVSMSSDGTRVAIGAYGNDGNGSDAGHVRVYEESGGTWTQVGSDIDGEAVDDMFGTSVSMSSDGTRVAIGSDGNDGTGTDAGHVRVYAESSGTWTQVGADIDGEAAGDYSGWSVSMSSDGTRVAIGAYTNDGTGTDSGHVRVYSESSGTWTQVGQDIDGEAADDYFGYSVSMSSDGTRVAIGATRNDGTGNNAGHVRVYAESSGTWTQVGADIDGEAGSDKSGWSVSMSSDGTRVTIGAPYNGSNAGHVRVYDWPMIRSKKILKENIVEVSGELIVSGNATVSSNLTVSGNATVSSNLTVSGNVTMNGMTIAGNLAVAPPNSSDGTLYYDTTQKRLYVLEDGNWVSLIGDINNSTSFQPSDITNYYAHYQASNYSGSTISDLSGNNRNGTGATGVTQRHAWHGEFGAKSYFATLYGTESGGTTGRVALHPDVLPPLYTIVTLTRRYTPPDSNAIDHIGRVITFDNVAGAATSSHGASAGYGRAENWLLGHWGDQSGIAFFGGWVATNVSSGVTGGQYGNTTGSQWLISIGKPGYYASKVQGSDWNTDTISNDGSNNGFKFDRICIGGGTYEACNWEFAEMIVYNRELSDSEIESLKRHMQAKYNIY